MLGSKGRLLKTFVATGVAALALSLTACGTSQETSETDAAGAGSFTPMSVKGRITSCHDGDTCSAVVDGTRQRLQLRFAGVDAPEVSGGASGKGQPFGVKARDFLNSKVKGKRLEIRLIEKDMYGRTIAEVFADGQLVNLMLVQEGLAEAYKWAPNKINKKAYRDAEIQARNYRKGVWSQNDYLSPGDFRRAGRQNGSGF